MNVPTGEPGRTQDHDAYASDPELSPASGSTAEPANPEPTNPEPTNPEPTDVGPAAAGSLRASDADRDQVAGLLGAAYAEGRLTREEHDERLAHLLTARTFEDLIPLTSDLVPLEPAPVTVSSVTPQFVVGDGASTEVDRMVAVFGGVERHGRWRMRARSQITAVFGGVDLDLRDADFDAPVLEINVSTCFGGVDLKVPAGVTVRTETVNIFGGTDVKNVGEPVEGAPTIVIKGTVFFGGIAVKGPKPRFFGRVSARPGVGGVERR
jgi:hypothetical protein